MERTEKQLSSALKMALRLREDMRQDGASEADCTRAIEKILRANWPAVPESEWPHWARVPRCIHCDGYGLVMRTVVNRLNCVVEEGTPCTCQAGMKFLQKPKSEADFTAAGKTTKPKGFTRWNG